MTPRPEDLLAHVPRLRALARSLVTDPATADDLLQETWTAAMAHPPAAERPLGPWLGRVLRNAARQRRRGDARRTVREERTARGEGLPPAGTLVERMELQRELVDSVLALREPYRSAIVLRYYEGLSAADIAREQGVPAATVRSQLKRGLEELRRRLDERHGGNRDAWASILLPWAAPEAGAATATGATAGGLLATWHGILAMNTALKVGVAAAVVAVAVVGYHGIGPSGEPVDPQPTASRGEVAAVLAQPGTLEEELEPLVESFPSERVEARVESAAPEAGGDAVEPSGWIVEARAVDESLRPIRGAVLRLGSRGTSEPSGPDGHIRVLLDPEHNRPGRYGARITHPAFATRRPTAELVEGEQRVWLGDLVLQPGGSVRGRVFGPDGAPLPGARVKVAEPRESSGDGDEMRRRGPRHWERYPEAVTAADGAFLVEGVPAGYRRVWAGKRGMFWSWEDGVEVRAGEVTAAPDLSLALVPAADSIEGVLLDPDGAPLARAWVRCVFRHDGREQTWFELTDDDGGFQLTVRERVPHDLRAESPNGQWPAAVADAVEPGSRGVVLRFRAGRTFELVPRGPGGSAVASFQATTLNEDQSIGIGWYDPEPEREGVAVVLEPDERFLVRVRADGFAEALLGPFEPGEVGPTLECRLSPVAGIRGRVVDRDGDPVAGAEVKLHTVAFERLMIHHNGFPTRLDPWPQIDDVSDENGAFHLTPREAGDYALRAAAQGFAATVVEVPGFDPAAAAQEIVVVLGKGGVIEGRVIAEDPSGTVVGVNRNDPFAQTMRVGPDGEFRFELLTPGKWNVELLDANVDPENASSIHQALAEPRPEFEWVVEVFEGGVARHDLDLAERMRATVRGELTVDGAPAESWSASLYSARYNTGRDADNPTTFVGADGRFELSVPRTGAFTLMLRHPEQSSFSVNVPLELEHGERPFELALATGSLAISNAPPNAAGHDRLYVRWDGPGGASVHLPVRAGENGRCRLTVPAGDVSVVRYPAGPWNPESADTLAAAVVPAGGTARLRVP